MLEVPQVVEGVPLGDVSPRARLLGYLKRQVNILYRLGGVLGGCSGFHKCDDRIQFVIQSSR